MHSFYDLPREVRDMIYGFLIQQVNSMKVERRKKREALLAKHGSSPTLLAPLMIVSRQVGKETVDALRCHLRTFRRVELQTWKYCNYLLDFSATASPRSYSECPYLCPKVFLPPTLNLILLCGYWLTFLQPKSRKLLKSLPMKSHIICIHCLF